MKPNPRAELDALLQRIASLLGEGAGAEAEAMAAQGRQQFPLAAELIRLHGVALLQLGRREEASRALHRAQELAPDSLELQCNLATLALENGQAEAAIARLRATLPRAPGHPVLLQALGMALMVSARYHDARDSFAEAAQNAPQHPGLRLHLAEAELELGEYTQALHHVQHALALAPRLDAAHAVYARILRALGRTAEAAQAWLQAERLAPGEPRYAFQAARMFGEAGQPSQAAAGFARALELAPRSGPAMSWLAYARRRLADWEGHESLTARLRDAVAAGIRGVVPFALLVEPIDGALQRQAAEAFAEPIEQHMAPLRRQLALAKARMPADAPLRVGLLSHGFAEQGAGRSLLALLEALATRPGLEIHLFSTDSEQPAALRTRLAAAAPLHVLDRLPPAQAARRIHALGIELLLDLTGYGTHTHAELLALRPAPLQLSWLGYPGTSGAPWIDYVLVDGVVLPPEHRPHFSEKVLRLPRCFMPVALPSDVAATPTRADCGLPARGMVFASLHDTAAIGAEWFACAMAILREVPESVLWLREAPDGAPARLRDAAGRLGVAPQRLVFLPPMARPQELARYGLVDLYLDSQPCGAQATAADALAMGCPLLTCAGATFAGRIGASLLQHLHLPELVANDADDFVMMGIELGRHRAALQAARAHLQRLRASSPVFDLDGFAVDLHRLLQTIGTRARMGRPPIDLDF